MEIPGKSQGSPWELPRKYRKVLGNPENTRRIPENPEPNHTPFQLHPIEGPLRKSKDLIPGNKDLDPRSETWILDAQSRKWTQEG